jgi:hypothetical protein
MNYVFDSCPIEEQNRPTILPSPSPSPPPPSPSPPPPPVAIRQRIEAPPLPEEDLLKLKELMDKIEVFDILGPHYISAAQFIEEYKDSYPFIVRNSVGKYTGDAIDWPASSSSGKEFIECLDNAPVSWQANSYRQFIKPNARKFIKITISGSPTLVIKPDWYDNGTIPGTKFFQLVTTNQPVFKFMTTVLASQNLPEDFLATGSDHCNQISPLGVYTLEPISVEQLSNYVTTGGKRRKRISKTKKNSKTKKVKKIKKNSKTKKLKKINNTKRATLRNKKTRRK